MSVKLVKGSPNSPRLKELDGLRGIAALIVLLFHYFYQYDSIYGHDGLYVDWSRFGHYGVELFFMISGYVIYWSLERSDGVISFVISRFSRLYPAYWFSVALTFLVVSLMGLPGREVSVDSFFVNLTMLQTFLGHSHVDGVYWSLTVELLFYFWMGILLSFHRIKDVNVLLALFLGLGILQGLSIIHLPSQIQTLLILGHINNFAVGISLFSLQRNPKHLPSLLILALCFVQQLSCGEFEAIVVWIILAALFSLSVFGKLRFLRSEVFVFLGAISYPLYLLHQNIGYTIILKCYAFGWPGACAVFASIIVSILLAFFVHRFIELPGSRYLKRIMSNLRHKKV